ncbi:tetratricopeptide repeat protein [Nocardia huaxiensis]|uniref:tetratricopeptide repeat protein n=1 Tax=Nocardia huaxiensis TaxID=2755382 RepID=UPI001E337911|nr:tetratricopeptide repeat protein [Nocardia huaxiensis]UFS98778.1 tetratricopeptide repeat protein [Nocardia huaxiensis]
MNGGVTRDDNQQGNSARVDFAAGVVALFAAAGNPTLQRVATASERHLRLTRGAGRKTTNLVPRISDWRAGRNLPSRFETFHPVLLTLLELARANGGAVAVELADVAAWHRLWTDAQNEGAPRAAVVNTLRRDIGTFVGRDGELSRLLASALPGRVVSIHTIDGMAGVGKTALATRAAHLLADRFPDGQYFVELHAHTPGQTPADPADVLGTLLVDFGVDPRNLPETLAARRNLWRDHLAGRRVLLVLDDARDHDQIEPLLPGGGDCLTLVTSRRRLVALDGAAPMALGVLDPAAAVELFSTLSGHDAADTTRAIVDLCGYLPLAISLLAGRVAHHPNWTLDDVVVEFAAARARLDELDSGHRAVRAAFTTSYERLPENRRRLFRRLGAHPGLDIDAYAVAALDDTTVAQARRELEALYAEHLIDETSYGRYRMHDLIRAYAQELIAREPGDRDAALDRLMDYYQHTALRVVHRDTRPAVAQRVPEHPDLSAFDAALSWIRVERANLLACLTHAAADGRLSRAVDLTAALVAELELHGATAQAVAMHERMNELGPTVSPQNAEVLALKDLGAAGYLAEDYPAIAALLFEALKRNAPEGDPFLTAKALRMLSRVRILAKDFHTAVDDLRQARETLRTVGDRHGEAAVLKELGWASHIVGDYAGAAGELRDSLSLFEHLGARSGAAAARRALAWVEWLRDDRRAAVELISEAARIHRELGRRADEAVDLSMLAWFHHLSGDYPRCAALLRQSLIIHRDTGNRSAEAFVLSSLASVDYTTGDYATAVDLAQQAHAHYRALANPAGEASMLTILGRIRCAQGEYDSADASTREALEIYTRLGTITTGRAEALSSLGRIRHRTGDHDAAADLLHQALALYGTIGHLPGETETRNRLAALQAESDPAQAFSTYQQALRLAEAIRNPLEQARAHEGLAHLHLRSGEERQAISALTIAVDLYTRLGAAETASATAFLRRLRPEKGTEPARALPS